MTTKLRQTKLSTKAQKAKAAAKRDQPDKMLLPSLIQERHKIYQERVAKLSKPPVLLPPTRICNGTVARGLIYDPYKDMLAPCARAGANDHEAIPSLHAGVLTWRNGTKAQA